MSVSHYHKLIEELKVFLGQRVVAVFFHSLSRFIPIKRLGEFPLIGSDKPLIIVCNHHSMKDSFVWTGSMPLRRPYLPAVYQGKPGLFKSWLGNMFFRSIGIVPIERKSGRPLSEVLASAVETVEEGRSIFLMVEGTRTKDPIIKTVKPGAAFVALKTGTPILPVAIRGTLKRENGKTDPYAIVVGAPIVVPREDSPSRESVGEVSEKIREAITDMQMILLHAA